MSVIKAQDADLELYKKISELEKRIKQNENKKKLINYNKFKYFIFNNKYIIINLLLLFINLYLLYLNFFNQESLPNKCLDKNISINVYEVYESTIGTMHLESYESLDSRVLNTPKLVQILGFCQFKNSNWFLWKHRDNKVLEFFEKEE